MFRWFLSVRFMNIIACTYLFDEIHDEFMRNVTYSQVTWLINEEHDLFITNMTPSCVSWLTHMWNVLRSNLGHGCLMRLSMQTTTWWRWRCYRCFVMGWLWLVGSFKLQVSFAKEPCKRDYILQKRRIIWRSLLIVATPFHVMGWLRLVGSFKLSCLIRHGCPVKYDTGYVSHQNIVSFTGLFGKRDL